MQAIVDGTSNTISVSEAVSATSGTARIVRGGVGNFGPAATAATPLTTCYSHVSTTDRKALSSNMSNARRQNALFSGMALTTGFQTILPPNSLSCGGSWSNSEGIATAQSYHPGGVQGGRADGSAQFISDTINARTSASETEVSAGESPYGVWGALGTVDGGESKTL